MSGEQRLNSVDRFRKQPSRLVLEEHSNCEVPAGCGGVVLRWRNPHAAVPLTIHLYSPGKAACFIDGAPLATGRLDLAPGRHVVAIVLEDVERSDGLLLFAAEHQPRKDEPAGVAERAVRMVTAEDETWKFSLDPPESEEWKMLGHDDGDWPCLHALAARPLERGETHYWQWQECHRAGAACLGLGEPVEGKGTVWVRKVFELHPPEDRTAPEGSSTS